MRRKLLPGGDPRRAARRLVMAATGPVNGLITALDRLGIHDQTFPLENRLLHWHHGGPTSESRLVAGVAETVRALASRYQLTLVTTRSTVEAQELLEREGLQDVLPVVVARDSSRRLKPHPQPVQQAAQQLDVDVARCAMVGDTRVDIHAAKAAGALAVGVLSGLGKSTDLLQADLIPEDVTALEELLLS